MSQMALRMFWHKGRWKARRMTSPLSRMSLGITLAAILLASRGLCLEVTPGNASEATTPSSQAASFQSSQSDPQRNSSTIQVLPSLIPEVNTDLLESQKQKLHQQTGYESANDPSYYQDYPHQMSDYLSGYDYETDEPRTATEATSRAEPRQLEDPSKMLRSIEQAVPERVDPNDPELASVFPSYAAQYKYDVENEEHNLEEFAFVDRSDFAVFGSDGTVESYGDLDALEETVDALKPDKASERSDELGYQLQNMPRHVSAIQDQIATSLEDGQIGGGTTTLMLFNIFTPDEVDFLSELVGEDVVKELKDDAKMEPVEEEKTDEEELEEPKETLETRASLQSYHHPSSSLNHHYREKEPVEQPARLTPSGRPPSASSFYSGTKRPSYPQGYQTNKPYVSSTPPSLYAASTTPSTPVFSSTYRPRPSPRPSPKNGPSPSSRGEEHLGSNTRGSLVAYSKPMPSTLGQEGGKLFMTPRPASHYGQTNHSRVPEYRGPPTIKTFTAADFEIESTTSRPRWSPSQPFRKPVTTRTPTTTATPSRSVEPVEDRRQKMEILLDRLSDKYNKRKQEAERKAVPPHKKQEEDEKNDRMKVMIENLKAKLASSRPGVSRLNLENIYEEQGTTTRPTFRTTTAKTVPLTKVENLLGEQLKKLHGGIHRLNLDEVLDLDNLNLEKAGQDSDTSNSLHGSTVVPHPPQGPSKNLPKRNIVHPKLRYQRQGNDIIHRPSINLKNIITPVPDTVISTLTKRPMIHRYAQEASKSVRKLEYPKGPLGPERAPSPQRLRGDPFPETKELPPYHFPTSRHPIVFTTPRPNGLSHSTVSPPPPYYPDRPANFNPSLGPAPYIDQNTGDLPNKYKVNLSTDPFTVPPIPSHEGPVIGRPRYTPSSSYRQGKKHSGKYEGRNQATTQESEYKQPSIKFDHDGKQDYITVTPKNYPSPTQGHATHPSQQTVHVSSLPPRHGPSNLKASEHPYSPASGQRKSKMPENSHNSYLPPSHEKQNEHPPRDSYLPPKEDMSHYHAPEVSYLPPHKEMSHMRPPNNAYLPPQEDMKNMLPPKLSYHPPRKEMTHMQPPNESYLPPQGGMNHMTPPKEKYLPPHKDMKHMAPPIKPYHTPRDEMAKMKPPSGSYLPPHEDMKHMSPPNELYHPPHHEMAKMQPPSGSYVPPHEDLKHMHAPKGEYLPPHKERKHLSPPTELYHHPHHEMTKMKPPTGSYLPPHEDMKHMVPPKEKYLPPHEEMKHMSPPNEFYHPPHHEMTKMKPPTGPYLPPHKDMTHMHPPSNGYLPPKDDMSHYNPPKASYLPPHEGMKHMQPPETSYHPPHDEMTHMQPPKQSYLPPDREMKNMSPPKKDYVPPHKDMIHMTPPEKLYHPPHLATTQIHHSPGDSYLPPQKDMKHMQPPKESYHPPHKDMKHIQPPNEGYIPPHSYMKKMQPPKDTYQPPHGQFDHMHPPESVYIPPQKEMDHMQPPNREYIPPGSSRPVHSQHPTHIGMAHMSPPEKSYLPPHKDMRHMEPPKAPYLSSGKYEHPKLQDEMKHMRPPKTGYIPPHQDMKHMLPPSENYRLPEHGMASINPLKSSHLREMSHMQPPKGGYVAPHDEMKQLQPPKDSYLPPHEDMTHMHPPTGSYLLPQTNVNIGQSNREPQVDMTHLEPPKEKYLPPTGQKDSPSYHVDGADLDHSHHDLKHSKPLIEPHGQKYPPPEQTQLDFKSAHELSGPTPTPHALLLKMNPPKKGYSYYLQGTDYLRAKSKHPSGIIRHKAPAEGTKLSKAHFRKCPRIEGKPEKFCKNSKHTCWSEGVRDLDCPLGGLCCFDGCANVCLPYNYGDHGTNSHQSSHEEPRTNLHPVAILPVPHGLCPARKGRQSCTKYANNQCQSPGVPDLDCPGGGLCCFDGCNNVCINGHHQVENSYHVHHHHHVSYHVPQNSKYVVPGISYASHGRPTEENERPLSQPVPNYGMSGMYSLAELDGMKNHQSQHPHDHQDKAHMKTIKLAPPSLYKPPARDYLPPVETSTEKILDHLIKAHSPKYLPPKVHPDISDGYGMTHMIAPYKSYLPPPYNQILEILPRPQAFTMSHYQPPNKGYLSPHGNNYEPEYQTATARNGENYKSKPSHQNVEEQEPTDIKESRHYKPPGKDYLPPDQHDGYLPPNPSPEKSGQVSHKNGVESMHKGKLNDFKPPSKDYLPPRAKEAQHEKKHLNSATEMNSQRNIKPPSKDYLPPQSFVDSPQGYKEKAVGEENYAPVKNDHDLQSQYELPTKDYLPPKKKTSHKLANHYEPPAKSYLPPERHNTSEDDHGSQQSGQAPNDQFKPPKTDYLPPKATDDKLDSHYQPPKSDYLPPKATNDKLDSHYQPPKSDYLPPRATDDKLDSHYQPPKSDYLPPKATEDQLDNHFQPPKSNYLPPLSPKSHLNDHYQPPKSDYLPPESTKHGLDDHYQPPKSDYLPPKEIIGSHSVHDHYQPPKKAYLPPVQDHKGKKNNFHRVSEHYKPPQKSYLPPKDDDKTPTDYNPPAHGNDLLENHYKPPQKDYLPPTRKEVTNPHEEYKPLSKDYLSPVPPKPYDHDLNGLDHESKNYTPPETPKIIINGESYDKKKYVHKPGDLSVDYVGPSPTQGLPPHSINIQINIPNKDEFNIGKGLSDSLSQSLGGHDHMDEKSGVIADYIPGSPAVKIESPPVYDPDLPGPYVSRGEPDIASKYLPPAANKNAKHEYHPKPDYQPTNEHPPKEYISTLKHIHGYKPDYIPTGKLLPQSYLPPNAPFTRPQSHPHPPHGPHGIHLQSGHPHAHPPVHVSQLSTPIISGLPDYDPTHHLRENPNAVQEHLDVGLLSPVGQGFNPPSKSYIPPNLLPKHSKSNAYLPPPPSPEVIGDGLLPEAVLPDPTVGLGLELPKSDYLPPLSRGPQFPVRSRTDYLPPPPRPEPTIPEPPPPEVISPLVNAPNSQTLPPTSSSDHYIPPKTRFDIPTNFVRPEDVVEEVPEPPPPEVVLPEIDPDAESIGPDPTPFLGLAKLVNETGSEAEEPRTSSEEDSDESNDLQDLIDFSALDLGPSRPRFPPIPTLAPQPDSFIPLLEELSPALLKRLRATAALQGGGSGTGPMGGNKIPGIPGKDYPDFKTIPTTAFSCENFILEGFYADTFTSCQVFHVCESGKRQSSFLCPKGTIFNQKHRVCDWWYNVKCEDSTEFYDLNLDLLLLENEKRNGNRQALPAVPAGIDPLAGLVSLDNSLLSSLGSSASSLFGGAAGLSSRLRGSLSAKLLTSPLMNMGMNGLDRRRSDDGNSRMDTGPPDDLQVKSTPSEPAVLSHAIDKASSNLDLTNKYLDDLDENEIDDLTDRQLSQLATDLAALEQLKEDLKTMDDDQLKEMLTSGSSESQAPPKRLTMESLISPANNRGVRANQQGSPSNSRDSASKSRAKKAKTPTSLCRLMNICDRKPEPKHIPTLQASPSTLHYSVSKPPVKQTNDLDLDLDLKSRLMRTGEKTASQIARIYADSDSERQLIDGADLVSDAHLISSLVDAVKAADDMVMAPSDRHGVIAQMERLPKMFEEEEKTSDAAKEKEDGSAADMSEFKLSPGNIDTDKKSWRPTFVTSASEDVTTKDGWKPLGEPIKL